MQDKVKNNDPTLHTISFDELGTNEVGVEFMKVLESNTYLTSIVERYPTQMDELFRLQIAFYLERNKESIRQAQVKDFVMKLCNNDPSLTESGSLDKLTDEEIQEITNALKHNNTLKHLAKSDYQ